MHKGSEDRGAGLWLLRSMVPPAEPPSPGAHELATLYRARPIAPSELTPLMRRYVPNAVALRLDSGAVSGSDVLSEIREVSVVFINLKGLKLAQSAQGANQRNVQRGQAHHAHTLGNHRGGTAVVRRPSSQTASLS